MPPLSEVPASGKGYTPIPSPLPPVTQRLDHSPGWKGPDPPVSQMEKTRRNVLGVYLRSHVEAGAHNVAPGVLIPSLGTPTSVSPSALMRPHRAAR